MDYKCNKKEILNEIRGIIFDLDGVLWTGKKVIPGAVKFINQLNRTNIKIRFISNTSSRSHEKTLKKMKDFGFKVKARQIIVASKEISIFLSNKLHTSGNIYVIGTDDLKSEIKNSGLNLISEEDLGNKKADYVVAGFDKNFSYKKMRTALKFFEQGAGFAAVNLDITAPSSDGLIPAAGSIVKCIEALAGGEIDIMIGKPEPYLLNKGIKSMQLSAKECIMVGDTPEADVKAARNAGLKSILVLSGNFSKSSINKISGAKKPDLIINSISDLNELLEER